MRKNITAAFLVWNKFQFFQFDSLTESIKNPLYLYLLKNGKQVNDSIEELDRPFLLGINAPVAIVKESELVKLDGQFDVLFCQTQFIGMEKFTKTKIVAVQYSMSKEKHQYGAWRSLVDLNLTYGRYSETKVSFLSPAVSIGNPRFDRWFEGRLDPAQTAALKARLDPSRQTLLYMPTWGRLSSIPFFMEAVTALASEYNLIVKVHHNTSIREQDRVGFLTELGAREIFGESDDLLPLIGISDLVMSDFSGAIFDAIYMRKKVVLLQHNAEDLFGVENFGPESAEYSLRDRLGAVVSEPEQLARVVAETLSGALNFDVANAELKAEFFAFEGGCGPRTAEVLEQLLEGEYQPESTQIYVREKMVQLRRFQTMPKPTRSKASKQQARTRAPKVRSKLGAYALWLPRLVYFRLVHLTTLLVIWSGVGRSGFRFLGWLGSGLGSKGLTHLAACAHAKGNEALTLFFARKCLAKSKSVGQPLLEHYRSLYNLTTPAAQAAGAEPG